MGRKRKAEFDQDFDQLNKEDDPIQRNAANSRERDRMRVLSKAFTKLKTTLPWVPPDTKLSKLDTLRLASCYIAHLQQILTEDNWENSPVMAGIAARNSVKESPANTVHPMALSWPFSFNGARQNDGTNFSDSACPNRTPNSKPVIINSTS